MISNQLTDYVIDSDCGIERKTINDFIISIKNKRVFNQINNLVVNFKHPLIILEGGGIYLNRGLNPNMIRGVILWMSINKRLPIIRTRNKKDTVSMLYLLAKQRQTKGSKKFITLKFKKQRPSLYQEQVQILETISGIGPKLAIELMAKYGNLANIVKATDEDLNKLQNLGKSKISHIKKLFTI